MRRFNTVYSISRIQPVDRKTKKQREKEKIHDPLAEILQEKILRAHGSMPMPNELTEENWKDADVLIDRFGTFAIKCLYSREWRLREAAVATICEFVLFNTLPEHRLYTFISSSIELLYSSSITLYIRVRWILLG